MEAIQSNRFSSFCCGVYSFLYHPNLSKTDFEFFFVKKTQKENDMFHRRPFMPADANLLTS